MPAEVKKLTKFTRRIEERGITDANHVPQPSAGEPQGQRKICQDPSPTRRLRLRGYSSRVMLSGRLPGSQAFSKSRRETKSPESTTCCKRRRLFERSFGPRTTVTTPWFRAIHLTRAWKRLVRRCASPSLAYFARRFTRPRFCPTRSRSSCLSKSTSHMHGRLFTPMACRALLKILLQSACMMKPREANRRHICPCHRGHARHHQNEQRGLHHSSRWRGYSNPCFSQGPRTRSGRPGLEHESHRYSICRDVRPTGNDPKRFELSPRATSLRRFHGLRQMRETLIAWKRSQ